MYVLSMIVPSQSGPVKADEIHTHSEQEFLRYPKDSEQLLSLPMNKIDNY